MERSGAEPVQNGSEKKKKARRKTESSRELYPVVPDSEWPPSNTDLEAEMGETDVESIDASGVSDNADGDEDASNVHRPPATAATYPQDQLRGMMHAKDDEIQDLKLQLHDMHRQSQRFSRASVASTTMTPGPPVDPQPTAAPSSSKVEMRSTQPSDAGQAADAGARPALRRLPVPPALTDESRILERELRHGRLTDHVKSSANRGDLESFIAATCGTEEKSSFLRCC
jgi:hypothetical protein